MEGYTQVKEGDRVWAQGWFPVLFELSCIISRCKMDVRTRYVIGKLSSHLHFTIFLLFWYVLPDRLHSSGCWIGLGQPLGTLLGLLRWS